MRLRIIKRYNLTDLSTEPAKFTIQRRSFRLWWRDWLTFPRKLDAVKAALTILSNNERRLRGDEVVWDSDEAS